MAAPCMYHIIFTQIEKRVLLIFVNSYAHNYQHASIQIIYDVALFSHGTVTLYINLWENEAVSLLKSNIKRDFY